MFNRNISFSYQIILRNNLIIDVRTFRKYNQSWGIFYIAYLLELACEHSFCSDLFPQLPFLKKSGLKIENKNSVKSKQMNKNVNKPLSDKTTSWALTRLAKLGGTGTKSITNQTHPHMGADYSEFSTGCNQTYF